MRAALLALALTAGAGCISERMGYAAEEESAPTGPVTLREAVAALGNPSAMRDLPEGGTEAVWAGTATEGGAFAVSFWGIQFVRLGRTATAVRGRRLLFGADGRLSGSWPVGEGEPEWGVLPFGRAR